MPKLKKAILPEGEYLVSTPSGGRKLKKFDAEYLATVAKTSNDMIEAGLRIPAPFKHLKEAVPTVDEMITDSFDNSGYWESFEIVEEKGKKVLYGVIDSPGDISNLSTPAGKLNSTIKEVSACIKDSWVDGLGRSWGPCILHCAPVLHPVVPGQEGFTLLEDTVALSMSGMAVEVSPVNLAQLSKELESIGLHIPTDTMLEELPKVLLTVIKQKQLCDSQSDEDSEVVETTSVFMSLPEGTKMPVTKNEAEHLLSLGAINPKTNKPFTMEDFEVKQDPKDIYALAVTNELIEQRRKDLRTRVSNLVETGRTPKEYAESSLYPLVDSYELSLGDGAKFQKNNVDIIIENLEALPAPANRTATPSDNGSLPHGSEVHNLSHPESDQAELSAEEAEKLKASFLSLM